MRQKEVIVNWRWRQVLVHRKLEFLLVGLRLEWKLTVTDFAASCRESLSRSCQPWKDTVNLIQGVCPITSLSSFRSWPPESARAVLLSSAFLPLRLTWLSLGFAKFSIWNLVSPGYETSKVIAGESYSIAANGNSCQKDLPTEIPEEPNQ